VQRIYELPVIVLKRAVPDLMKNKKTSHLRKELFYIRTSPAFVVDVTTKHLNYVNMKIC